MTFNQVWLFPALPCFALLMFMCMCISSPDDGTDTISWRHLQFGQIFWVTVISAIPVFNMIAIGIVVIGAIAEFFRDYYETLMSWKPFLKKDKK